ncbi:MAG: hypothetical protein EGP07_08820 [SAR202 cluster bacterium]|nr:MAG: hypothetical protein EGP07_08820 [SAR202 cluster bacterium]
MQIKSVLETPNIRLPCNGYKHLAITHHLVPKSLLARCIWAATGSHGKVKTVFRLNDRTYVSRRDTTEENLFMSKNVVSDPGLPSRIKHRIDVMIRIGN